MRPGVAPSIEAKVRAVGLLAASVGRVAVAVAVSVAVAVGCPAVDAEASHLRPGSILDDERGTRLETFDFPSWGTRELAI